MSSLEKAGVCCERCYSKTTDEDLQYEAQNDALGALGEHRQNLRVLREMQYGRNNKENGSIMYYDKNIKEIDDLLKKCFGCDWLGPQIYNFVRMRNGK